MYCVMLQSHCYVFNLFVMNSYDVSLDFLVQINHVYLLNLTGFINSTLPL